MAQTQVKKYQLHDLVITTTSTNYTVLPTDDVVIVDTTSGNVTITLLNPTTAQMKSINIQKKVAANVLYITTPSGVISNTAATISVYVAGVSLDLYPDGTNYQIK